MTSDSVSHRTLSRRITHSAPFSFNQRFSSDDAIRSDFAALGGVEHEVGARGRRPPGKPCASRLDFCPQVVVRSGHSDRHAGLDAKAFQPRRGFVIRSAHRAAAGPRSNTGGVSSNRTSGILPVRPPSDVLE